MTIVMRGSFSTLPVSLVAANKITTGQAQQRTVIEDRFADVNGIRLHYLAAGAGDPVILLHGYAQTSHMWRP